MKSVIIFIVLFPLLISSQSLKSDLAEIISKNNTEKTSEYHTRHIPDHFNIDRVEEYKTLFLGSVKLYQAIVSSQDNSVCNFTPSCSRFSSSVIRETGFLKGLLLTSDRLQRCNGSAYFEPIYKFDRLSNKFSDSVDFYLN